MEWNSVNDLTKEIPWTKVCIFDGANTFWAYLKKIETTQNQRTLIWDIIGLPVNYPEVVPIAWVQITPPKNFK